MQLSRQRGFSTDPFTDLLFNALLGFTFLFFVAIMFMNPIAKSGIINIKAEYIISISWEDNNPDDMDIWVESPRGDLVWFRAKEAGLLHLDRDDRGLLNDVIEVEGKEIVNPLNQEVVTLRGQLAGEYIVNAYYYASETKEPVDVTVKVEKVNPILEVAYYGNIKLDEEGQEKTALRFTIEKDGKITNINHLPKKLVRGVKD